MYQSYFGLSKAPFGLTPDTSFFFACANYQEALNTLLVAVRNGEGFIKITGEVGNGKTMLCRKFLATLDDNFIVANIYRPCLDPYHLLLALAEEFAIPLPENADQHQLLKIITQQLLAYARTNKHVVVCLDEAQTMSTESLETLRLLTNLETENYKLLQVVLFGQPELDERLAKKSMRQLRQRITFQHHLGGLLEHELEQYVNHRLNVAGYQGGRLFSSAAIRLMYRVTGGIPRLVNIIAHKALLLVYGAGAREVLPVHIKQAASDTPEAKFSWLMVRTNKFAMFCHKEGRRTSAMGLINKVLLDLQERAGLRESLEPASSYLRVVPGYLHLARAPKYLPVFLFLLIVAGIWGIASSLTGMSSIKQTGADGQPVNIINDFSLAQSPAKLSASVLAESSLAASDVHDHIIPTSEPAWPLAATDHFKIVPLAKPDRMKNAQNLSLQGKSFQLIPARKPTMHVATADQESVDIDLFDVDTLMEYKEAAMSFEPIVVASIAEDAGLLSSLPDQPQMLAKMHPAESVFNGDIIKQVNTQQQLAHEFQQAVLLAQQGRINDAMNKYDQILQLDATHEAARLALVGLLLESRRLDEVEQLLREGIRLNPGQTEFAKILSRIQVEKGNVEAALATLQHSLPQALNQPDYRAFMAALLQRQSRHKEAIEHYRAAVNLSPDTGVWLMGLGISLQEEGHFAEAHEVFRRAQMSHGLNEELQAFIDQRIRQTRRKVY